MVGGRARDDPGRRDRRRRHIRPGLVDPRHGIEVTDHADFVALLKPGVGERGGRWADLGAGEGAFTLALAELLGPEAHVIAVDKDRWALRAIGHGIETRVADFTKPLDLRDLDGIVMANSLHFVRNKPPVLELVKGMLRPGGRLIVVEYSSDRGNPWVPHPFSFATWTRLAEAAGFEGTELLHTVPSRYFGSMYSAVTRVSLSPEGSTD